jgi:hypothetical protein
MWQLLLAALIVLLIVYLYWNRTRHIAIVDADRAWNVSRDYDNRAEAAIMMRRLHLAAVAVGRSMKRRYAIDESPANTRAARLADALLDNYNPDVIYENDPARSRETAYTVNKGDALYVCLRDRGRPEALVDYDTLLFVYLHELSHIAAHDVWGHGEKFWETFKFVLEEAVVAGVYRPVDYSKKPTVYCGLDITYNPLFDQRLKFE